MKEDCIFCKIAGGDIPSSTMYEDDEFRVILDLNPASKGHCLIIPKQHFNDIYDMDEAAAGRLFSLAVSVSRALKAALHCDGLNLIQNNGSIAGQTVFHFHLHLIPRYEGDGVDLTWKPHTSVPEEQEALCTALREALNAEKH